MFRAMKDTRKFTADLPSRSLAMTPDDTAAGVMEPLKIAQERLARDRFYSRMRELRGKVASAFDLAELRKDREFDENGHIVN
jgi:hypothetical protein